MVFPPFFPATPPLNVSRFVSVYLVSCPFRAKLETLKTSLALIIDSWMACHCNTSWSNCQQVGASLERTLRHCIGLAAEEAWPVLWDSPLAPSAGCPPNAGSPPRAPLALDGWCNR